MIEIVSATHCAGDVETRYLPPFICLGNYASHLSV